VSDTAGRSELDAAKSRLGRLLPELETIGLGWATVDLERAATQPTPFGGVPVTRATDAPDDELLGARCRIVTFRDGPPVVLLEPSTEGRIAASLARRGEGLAVVYLAAARRDSALFARAASLGIAMSRPSPGPFGPSALVLGGPSWGPHLVLVDLFAADAPATGAATIER
jgi:hypothetical protein